MDDDLAGPSPDDAAPPTLVGRYLPLAVDDVAVGGAGVGHAADGRVVFVEGALPGEEVEAQVTEDRPRHLKARVVTVTRPSPRRRTPPCPHVAGGCGGCGWQHAADDHQVDLKVRSVEQALQRLGRIDTAGLVSAAPPLPATGHRTTARLSVGPGGHGFRAAHSHDVVAVDTCLVAHPLLDDLIARSAFPPGREVTLRVGARTGESLAVVSGAPDPDRPVRVPDGTRLVHEAELAQGRRAWIHEVVAGVRFRVSALSFFQARPDGADLLVAEVDAALAGAADGTTLVDLYAGVGLFAATAGRPDHVIAVESNASAAADARHNLAEQTDRSAKVVKADVARFRRRRAGAVVADPSRSGLGRAGVATVATLGAPVVVLVSCDAGSLGRDARLLTEAGYRLAGARVVDMFPQTPHVEVVSRFERPPGQLVGR